MKKVIILEKGLIARESDNCPIGRIIREADIPEKNPPSFRKLEIKLLSGKKAFLYYGGMKDHHFTIACGIPCKWGTSCLRYGKYECLHNPKMENIGYYLSESEL